MKKAEDYLEDFAENVLTFINGGEDKSVEIIKQIQRDARNSGLEEAANIIERSWVDGSEYDITFSDGDDLKGFKHIEDAIRKLKEGE